ncbi:MAG: hypothetical protein Q8R18_00455 [bacterium]|nr:hypothetical protein [bacterium]
MRWFRSSARNRILREVSFEKRGQILSGGSPSSGGNYNHSSGGAQSTGRNGIMIAVLLFALLVAGVFAYGYFSSERGQRAVQDFIATIEKYTLDPALDLIASIFSFGSGDYFSTNINSSSTKKGIDLDDFRAIAGETFPAGKNFDILYDIEYYNVPASSSYEGDFSCYFNVSKIGDTKVDPPERKEGEIISSDAGIIRKGSTTYCRIHEEDTEDLNGAYTFYGSFIFAFETKDAVLPVYFIPGELADQLGDTDFFDAYDLPISQGDLQVTYNGEPISVAIGVGGEGEEQQPVILRGGETSSFNTVGITLTNEWKGNIAELKSVTLYLPDGISLSEELNGEANAGCPLVSAGRDERRNMYVLDDSAKEELFTYYIKTKAFFGKSNYRTFQCWIEVEEDFLGDAPYVVKEYEVDVSYLYQTEEEQETISIVPRGDSLVVEQEIVS